MALYMKRDCSSGTTLYFSDVEENGGENDLLGLEVDLRHPQTALKASMNSFNANPRASDKPHVQIIGSTRHEDESRVMDTSS
jgi:hypothetical protein